MIPAAHIKKTIDFNARFAKLLEVLKLVAVSQYYILERRLSTFDEFQGALEQFFDAIDLTSVRHPFVKTEGRPAAIVAVTSDAGLLGGMNQQVMTKAIDLVRETGGRLVIIGEKGQGYAQDAGLAFTYFEGVQDAERYRQALELRDFLIHNIVRGAFGPVVAVYPRAISFVIHRVQVEALLPFVRPEPKEGAVRAESEGLEQVILESTPAEILEYLVYLFLGNRFYEIFGMSRLAEQAARFTHLEESCQKIQDMNKKLLLQYFRRRHEMIDQNMRELYAARALYAK